MKKMTPFLLLLLTFTAQAQAFYGNCTVDLVDSHGVSKSLHVSLPKSIQDSKVYRLASFEGQMLNFRISEGSILFPLDIMSIESVGPNGDDVSGEILSENGQASVIKRITSKKTNATLTIMCVSSDKPLENSK